jgi:hypothetical protein
MSQSQTTIEAEEIIRELHAILQDILKILDNDENRLKHERTVT